MLWFLPPWSCTHWIDFSLLNKLDFIHLAEEIANAGFIIRGMGCWVIVWDWHLSRFLLEGRWRLHGHYLILIELIEYETTLALSSEFWFLHFRLRPSFRAVEREAGIISHIEECTLHQRSWYTCPVKMRITSADYLLSKTKSRLEWIRLKHLLSNLFLNS